MKILLKPGASEIEVKKSKFIATLKSVTNEEEAQAFINEMKKKYWDAKHNCSAFVIGKNAELTRCSDDGEPAQTAGRPMLNVLLHSEVRNVVCVVTRYFGGTLLGTGGLIKAYSDAVAEALEVGMPLKRALVADTDGTLAGLVRELDAAGVPVERVPRARLDSISSHGAHQGIAVQAERFRYAELEDVLERVNSKGKTTSLVTFSLSETYGKNLFSFLGQGFPCGQKMPLLLLQQLLLRVVLLRSRDDEFPERGLLQGRFDCRSWNIRQPLSWK